MRSSETHGSDNKFGVFGARRANDTGREHESPVSGFGIAKIRESGNLNLNKVGIWWRSD
jgi:hypothetical protein